MQQYDSPPKRKWKIAFLHCNKELDLKIKKKHTQTFVFHIRKTSPEFLTDSGFAITPKLRNTLLCLSHCAGFGWDKVRFLRSSLYGAMVWICAENSAYTCRDVSVIAEQAWHRATAFSAPHSTPPPIEWAGEALLVGRGHSQGSWPQVTQGRSHTIWLTSNSITWKCNACFGPVLFSEQVRKILGTAKIATGFIKKQVIILF